MYWNNKTLFILSVQLRVWKYAIKITKLTVKESEMYSTFNSQRKNNLKDKIYN